jgi:hypothetical protein
VVDNWPDYEIACALQLMVGQIYEQMLNNGLLAADQANPLIVEAYNKVIEQFPESSGVKNAQFKIERYQNPGQIPTINSPATSDQGGAQ